MTQDRSRDILKGYSVYLEEGKIAELGLDLRSSADYVIDGRGKALVPGLINTHTHLSMTLFRGYADDLGLEEWLRGKVWPIEAKLNPELCYLGALIGCLEMVRSGTTCFLDMYYFQESVGRAVEEVGLRAFLSHGLLDILGDDRQAPEPWLRERCQEASKSLLHYVKSLGSSRVKFAVSPHAPYTCSDELLLWARDLAEKEGALLHTHLAESRREQATFEERYGRREVDYLDEVGFLSPSLVAAHCVWLTRSEVKTLARRGVKVSYCPVSNLKLGQGGVAPVPEMLEEGMAVSLGTDGAATNNTLDLFDTMRLCALVHKAYRWDPKLLPAQTVLDLATIHGARALGLESQLGSIELGKVADIVLIDLRSPSLNPIHGREGLVSNLVYAAKGHNVDTVIVDDRLIMSNRRVLTVDEENAYEGLQSKAFKALFEG